MFSSQIDNASGKAIKEVKATLQQVVKYHGTYVPPKPKAKKGKKKLKLKSKRKDTTALKKTKVKTGEMIRLRCFW